MLEQQTANILQMGDNARIVAMCAVVVLAYLADFLCCKLLVPLIRRVARRTAFKWDNYLAEGKSLNYVFHLIPPLVFLVVIPLLFPDPAPWKRLLLRGIYIYFIIIACRLVCEFISSIYVISSETEALRNKPLKGLYQMFKVLVVCIGAILVIGVLVDKDFTALIAGLGASAAVLMLIFKDTILGVVAGVQLSAYDMLRPGDWIVMDKYGVNGNLQLFRACAEHYLRNLGSVNSELTLLVRQLEPTSEGLPLQLYFFTRPKDWPTHEQVASEVMEHMIASLPEFGLRVFQKPSGSDLSGLNPAD